MINQVLAQIFKNMASYLEMNDDQKSFFKARAYKRASEVVDKFSYDFANPDWYTDINKMKKIEGIGQSIAEHIKEYVKTGKIAEYERLKKKSPVQLEELLQIQGIGPKTVLKLYKKLGVTNIKSLKRAAETNKITRLEGFGSKSQDNILKSIKFAILHKDRVSIAIAEEIAKHFVSYLQKDANIKRIELAGSLRRRKETVGDLDILVAASNPEKTMDYFVKYPEVEKVLGQGKTKASVWLKTKIQADIRVISEKSFGAALQYFIGNKRHNIKVRNIAISKGYKLSEYGLFSRQTGKTITARDEKDIYAKLGLQYIPPELRENEGEIEAAKINNLPKLITLEDIRSDIQLHTTWSDGKNTIEEMARMGIKLGYNYIGITDHFGKLKIAGAISENEFEGYLKAIKIADKKVKGIKILAGGEIEISTDGELEFAKEKLEKLDYVLASVHFSTKMSKDQMTKRIIKALTNPLTKILAHPTGRLIGQRPGFEFNYKEVFKVAREENVSLEINAHPARLDLNYKLVKLAIEMKCKIVINTDAHSTQEMELMRYGVDVARRGWVTKSDLLNPDNLT